MDDIFKALSDKGRRKLLDALRQKDGQTLAELEQILAEMSRFGVMKHLGVLEQSLLISTRKVGRYKYHYLNPIPLQQISDRWIARFKKPWIEGMVDLKYNFEKGDNSTMTNNQKPKHVYVILIQTNRDALWNALTNADVTPQYFFGLRIVSEWKKGAKLEYHSSETPGKVLKHGEILEITPKQKIVYSFSGDTPEDEDGNPLEADPFSRVTYEIEETEQACKLILTHDEFPSENTTYQHVGGGWPTIISGLKTLLETGKPLEV